MTSKLGRRRLKVFSYLFTYPPVFQLPRGTLTLSLTPLQSSGFIFLTLKSRFATALPKNLWRIPICYRIEGRLLKIANRGSRCQKAPYPWKTTPIPAGCLRTLQSLFKQVTSPADLPKAEFGALDSILNFKYFCCGQEQCLYGNPSCTNRRTLHTSLNLAKPLGVVCKMRIIVVPNNPFVTKKNKW